MGDWRMQGQGQRRRGKKPSSHLGGARPQFVNPPADQDRDAGRPQGTTKNEGFWDQAKRMEAGSEAKAREDEWSRNLREQAKNHPSMRSRRMRPEGEYFG